MSHFIYWLVGYVNVKENIKECSILWFFCKKNKNNVGYANIWQKIGWIMFFKRGLTKKCPKQHFTDFSLSCILYKEAFLKW